jgi:hypothetical protein
MAVTITPYNHTARLFFSGANATTDTYKVALLSGATYNATNEALSQVTSGSFEIANANGYTTGGVALTGWAVTTVDTKDAMVDANDAVWTASGAGIEARQAVIYNDTDPSDPPLYFIDFGELKVANAGSDFKIIWPSTGIAKVTVVVA